MYKCFKCSDAFINIDGLCGHITEVHNLKGRGSYKCSACRSVSDELWKYKRHLRTCKPPDDEESNDVSNSIEDLVSEHRNDQLQNFQKLLRKAALEMVCSWCGNMSFPRNVVFKMVADLENFLNNIYGGLETVIMPCVSTGNERFLEDFIDAVKSSFYHIKSESLLDTELRKHNLIASLSTIAISNGESMKINYKEEEDEGDNVDYEEFAESESSENLSEYEYDYDHEEEERIDREKFVTVIEMPIEFQIKEFLQLPNVYEKIKSNLLKLNEEDKLQHFVSGDDWKKQIQKYRADQIVLPLFLYMDEAQINNPMGTHTKKGKENFCYYSLPTIPNEYQSRLENIFVAYLNPGAYTKEHGNERCYNSLIETLTRLTEDGISISVSGEEIHVNFILGIFLGDNLELNNVLGFAKSFNAHYFCRICRLKKQVTQNTTKEIAEELRTRQNYDDDVVRNDSANTGISEYCLFNEIPSFHVTENSGVDTMHDVLWGILHYNLSEVVLHFVRKRKYFSLDTLNKRIKSFDFGPLEVGNSPSTIFMKKLRTKRFTMTASEMFCFATHLSFIIGDLVPEFDTVWQFYLKTMKFMDMCYLPSYNDQDIEDFGNVIQDMLQAYIFLFTQHLKPKHHFTIHYPRLTKRFGPLRYLQSMRYEAKHRAMKNYTKNTNSRRNISYSLARKLQYNFAARLITKKGLEDEIVSNELRATWLANEAYYTKVSESEFFDLIDGHECFVTNKVTVNGITFASGLCLPDFTNEEDKKLHQIVDLVLLTKNDLNCIYAVCRTFLNVEYDEHYGCNFVSTNPQSHTIVKIKEFLVHHYWPVKLHDVSNKNMFRCKRF